MKKLYDNEHIDRAMLIAAHTEEQRISTLRQELKYIPDAHPDARIYAAAIIRIEAAGGIVDLTTLQTSWPA